MVLLGGDMAVGIGSGSGLEMNIILKGPNANQIYLYTYSNLDFGGGASVGLMAGAIHFNWDMGRNLDANVFAQWSQGIAGGSGALSGQLTLGFTDGSWHVFSAPVPLYWGFLVGYGRGSASLFSFYSYSVLIYPAP